MNVTIEFQALVTLITFISCCSTFILFIAYTFLKQVFIPLIHLIVNFVWDKVEEKIKNKKSKNAVL